eukprot:TRINITY_DN17896_c0_g1_i1.p1 TRINITY_DN17896_c0_g1~~TRINITY_DN17896_c0_g1_i1.p1  ORF type:complete len:570 (+),score=198.44 TRINITY_DN17896_c0_g1_i1:115-1824(+)
MLLLVGAAVGDEVNHLYKEGDEVHVYGNKIGPFNNPLETYGYFDVLPWCPPKSMQAKDPGLGEALSGDELIRLSVDAHFRENVTSAEICSRKVTPQEAVVMRNAVAEQYWYQLYADELPVWAALGTHKDGTVKLFMHQRFSFGYNDDRIVVAKLTAENPVEISESGGTLTFTYSVEWFPSKVEFADRFRRYLDETFFEHRIHWFSVCNSFMIIFLLAGVVFTILMRTLKADFMRYSKNRDEDEMEFVDDSGWKQVAKDVFRVPPNHVLFCSLVGTGNQLISLAFGLILTSIASVVYSHRGALLTTALFCFALTSLVAGFSSATLFCRYSAIGPSISRDWIKTMLITMVLFPGTIAVTCVVLNFLALAYNSQQVIPFAAMAAVVALWGAVSCPLVLVGTLAGRHRNARHDLPRVAQIPRRIPESWYLGRTFIAAGGILPFGSILIELYFVFTSFWNYKFYYVYGFMLLVYLILIVVTACVSVVFTYVLLNAEDYRWQWSSFALGASTAGYIFLYATYFFFFKTKMTGLFMTAFYFGYMALFCFGFAILCGTIAYKAADVFVRVIYRIKLD